MKKMFALLLMLALLCLPFGALAQETGGALLTDAAGLLSPEDNQSIGDWLTTLSQQYGMSLVIVTVDDLGGQTAQAYADDAYNYGGYLPDGALFLIAMSERDMYVSTVGNAGVVITDEDIGIILDQIAPYLTAGRYADALYNYVGLLQGCLDQASRDAPAYAAVGLDVR